MRLKYFRSGYEGLKHIHFISFITSLHYALRLQAKILRFKGKHMLGVLFVLVFNRHEMEKEDGTDNKYCKAV